MASTYRGRHAVLATKHDKLPLIGPVLRERLGLCVQAAAVDTDALGTFTGEVPRLGTPWETAVAKARRGLAATRGRLGLASEGTIGPVTALGLGVVATELVVLVDEDRGIVVGETAVGYDLTTVSMTLSPGEDPTPLLAAARVPPHHLIVRPAEGPRRPLVKGVGVDGLSRAVERCAAASPDGRARVETDLRAHVCPSRRPLIRRAAVALGDRLARACPSCRTPGWGPTAVEIGVPCAWCSAEVDIVRSRIVGCVACPQQWVLPVGPRHADPSRCGRCNP